MAFGLCRIIKDEQIVEFATFKDGAKHGLSVEFLGTAINVYVYNSGEELGTSMFDITLGGRIYDPEDDEEKLLLDFGMLKA